MDATKAMAITAVQTAPTRPNARRNLQWESKDMNMVLTLALPSLAAGLLSFLSPCTVPLLPGYLGYIGGVGSRTIDGRRQATLAAVLFVCGFGSVFVLAGAGAGLAAGTLASNRPLANHIGGGVIMAMGVLFLAQMAMPQLNREIRPLWGRVVGGPTAAPVMGMAFALGWVPCTGPILASVLTLAASSATAASGALLLAFYTVGLGLPFITLALVIDHSGAFTRRIGHHANVIQIVTGAALLVFGYLIFAGQLLPLMAPALNWYAGLKWPPL